MIPLGMPHRDKTCVVRIEIPECIINILIITSHNRFVRKPHRKPLEQIIINGTCLSSFPNL